MNKNKAIQLSILLGIFFYISLNYSILFFDKKIIFKLTHEDGIIESLGALYFFIASILFFILYKSSRKGNDFGLLKTNKNIFYLLLGIAFFFAAGEEISWGQRIFNIHVPKVWEAINIQKEITIHNLIVFQKEFRPLSFFNLTSLNTWFTVFSFGFCFFIPLLNKMSIKVSNRLRQIGLPIVPIEIGFIFIISYLIHSIVKFFTHSDLCSFSGSFQDNLGMFGSIVEIRESIWAFLYLIIAVFWIKREKGRDL